MASALSACMPRTRSTTRRAFIGVTWTKRAWARAVVTPSRSRVWSDTTRPPVVLDVPAEGARRGELAKLVTDHRLSDEDGHMLTTVVHCDGVPQHGGHDHRATRPRLDDVLGALVVLGVHLLDEVVVHERTLFEGTRHSVCLSFVVSGLALLAGLAAADDEGVAGLVGPARPALFLAVRVHGVATTRGFAL